MNELQKSTVPADIRRPWTDASTQLPLGIARILVPTDFSPESKVAVRYAVRFAEKFGATIHLAHVIDSVGDLKDADTIPWNATAAEACVIMQRRLAALAHDEIEELLPVYSHVVCGKAFEQVVELARAFFCDLIIISTHGRVGLSRPVMGSTAERIIRHAHCPVLVVRTHERDFA